MRHEKISGGDPGKAGDGERSDPEEIDPGHEEQRAPDKGDQQRLTEIGLQHEEQREDAVQRECKLDAGYVAALLALVE